MWYIIWILVSAAIFSRSIDSKKHEWLALPSMLSCIVGGLCAFFTLLGII